MAMTPTRNRWGGQDVMGEEGVARWTQEDGHRKVMVLDRLERLQWSVEVTNTAPKTCFDFAWQEAQWAINDMPRTMQSDG